LNSIQNITGVRNIVPVTNQVYKVETTSTERDAAMSTLRSNAYNVITHHAYRPKDTEGTIYYLTDRILVGFKPNTTTEQIEKILQKYGLNIIKKYDELQQSNKNSVYLLKLTLASGENPLKIANRLVRDEKDHIEFAEPNMINRFYSAYIPPDTLFPRQWHLLAQDSPHLVKESSINAPDAWDITKGDRKIVVSLIDDGFDLNHPDFQGNGKVVFPKDYVDGDSNPFPATDHGDYHGTPCAGVAIASSNGVGVVGAAFNCAFMPVRFPLSADDDLMVEIFTEVGKRADVISCSWGPPPTYAPLSTPMKNTITNLVSIGGPRKKDV